MSTLRGSFSTQRRTLLLHIALVCLAVFCQHTMHLAKTASQPFRLTTCGVKVAAVSPLPESRLKVRIRRALRPVRSAIPPQFGIYLGAAPSEIAGLEASGRGRAMSRRDWASRTLRTQARPFPLRV